MLRELREVLYDADDLLDCVATDFLLKQSTMMESKRLREVRAFFSKLTPIISSSTSSIAAKKFKDVRKRLDSLANDMSRYGFSQSLSERQMVDLNQRRYTDSYRLAHSVIGRGEDTSAVLEFLFDESRASLRLSVIAIVGFGGIGKTTLAQLLFSDDRVMMGFDERWWVTISDISDEKEPLRRICGSMGCEGYHGLTVSELYYLIREKMMGKRYLLVLDDVWDCTASTWAQIESLFNSGQTGSKIIITTTSLKVAKVMHADKVHQLEGLSEESSWELFRTMAVLSEHDSYRIDLRRKIADRCYGVPLVLKGATEHLFARCAIEQSPDYTDVTIRCGHSLMSYLSLSYNRLSSALKQCLAYCSLFPTDYVLQKEEVIHLWNGQGFLRPVSDDETIEDVGNSYFMEFVERLFFQEVMVDEHGKVLCWKMHRTIHAFVCSVAEDESIMISTQLTENHKMVRHLSVGYETDSSWNIPSTPFQVDPPPLRSFLFLYEGSLSPLVLNELLTKFRLLRTLSLGHQNIEVVPSSIGELKHLRYLNLSHNKFTHLPGSITMLVNLLNLDISSCEELELLPDKLTKLSNLSCLDTKKCYRLKHMPPGFEKLTSLQYISFFKVGEAMDGRNSEPGVLSNLKLKGELEVEFDDDIVWDGTEFLTLPIGIRVLTINNYPGIRISYGKMMAPSQLHELLSLHICSSSKLEHVSLFNGLQNLETLQLSYLDQLEYIEIKDAKATANDALCFGYLTALKLEGLPKLRRWSREQVEAEFTRQGPCTSLPSLVDLTVRCCPELKSMPQCPHLQTLELNDVHQSLIQHLLSPSLDAFSSTASLSCLKTVAIWGCDLVNFPGENLASLRQLQVRYCYELKNLYLAPQEHNTLEELLVQSCLELELWEGKSNKGLDWDSLPKICNLTVIGMPFPDKLPYCLQQRQANGKLLINMGSSGKLLINMGPSNKYLNDSVHSPRNEGSSLTTYLRPGAKQENFGKAVSGVVGGGDPHGLQSAGEGVF